MNNQQLRLHRIGLLYNIIVEAQKKGKDCDEEKLLDYFSGECGVAVRTGREYLNSLIAMGKVKKDKKTIFIDDN